MKQFLGLAVLLLLGSSGASTARLQGGDFAAIKTRAEGLAAQGSFELAHRAWLEAASQKLAPEDRRWVEFRLADTAWRSAAGSQNPDTTELERASKSLEDLQRKIERPEERDLTWAEVEESLADFHWTRRNVQDFGTALPHYQNALDWWAGAREIDTARERWLAMVWRMAWPDRDAWNNGYWSGNVPFDILQKATRIAQSDRDKAQAQFLYGMGARYAGGDPSISQRGLAALESAIALGRGTPWYDDALFNLAQWYEQSGAPDIDENGQWTQAPDFVKALALYTRLVSEFGKGASSYHDPAQQAIQNILRPELEVIVPNAFLPRSEIGYGLSWRNVARVELSLYDVDLTTAALFKGRRRSSTDEPSSGEWLSTLDLSGQSPRASWTRETKDTGQHRPGGAELRLEEKLTEGAYVLVARAGEVSARDIVLVSSASLVLKGSRDKALVWFCDALTSEPIAGAKVRVWERWDEGAKVHWRALDGVTADDGTALFTLEKGQNSEQLFAAAKKGDRTAFSLGDASQSARDRDAWKIYAFTDRSTYRPNDSVHWKITARTSKDGKYATPSGRKLGYEITDPRGASFKKGDSTLDAFGSTWGDLETTDTMALGEYHVTFFDDPAGKRYTVGSATLFRLEEYKLPEFEVKVITPKAGGKGKLFRTGDQVEAIVDAQYYFGGAVSNADVEVLVHQKPFWPSFTREHEYPWFYERNDHNRWGWGGLGEIVKRETLKTDGAGEAHVTFDTPGNTGQDYEYTIEARVTDASRREISGSGRVRVTRRAYTVDAHAAHNIHRPGDKVEVVFTAQDANSEPVEAQGQVRVTRERWIEVWVDSAGREVRGAELENLRRTLDPFPPPSAPGERGWRLKSNGYESEEISVATVSTGAKGEARVTFVVREAGYYKARWTSRDDRKQEIAAETLVWVASGDTKELGYHSGGLEIVIDKDTFRAGESAPVMISAPASNRWVLFSVEGEVLHSYQVLHLEGTVKLLSLPLSEEHVPNVFLSAFSTSNGDALMDTKEVVVPPVDQFLDIQVTADREEYRPGDEGTLLVLAKDKHGEPVSAQLGLSLVDESVAAIQSEYAIDPRQFFFGEKRAHWIRTQSSFNQKGYVRLVVGDGGGLRDERQARGNIGREEFLDRDEKLAYGDTLGASRQERGGMGGGRRGRASGSYRGPEDGVARAGFMPAADESSISSMEKDGAKKESNQAVPAEGGDQAAVQVRSDFRATALWIPDLLTDATGHASVKVKYPDSLTRWKATARACATDARFGIGTKTTRTSKPLIARLQAPRFFVVGDELTVSGVLNNNTKEPMSVKPALTIEGLVLAIPAPASVVIPAEGEARVDWKVRVQDAGAAKLTLTARNDAYSDGMEKTFVVFPHGVDSMVARALKSKGAEIVTTLEVPAARKKETTRFTVQVAPSLAVTMLDALPYLIDYPYGCTEQTLSRFLPAAIVAKTLKEQGLSAEDAMTRAFGGIEAGSAAATHPKGKKSLDLLTEMTRQGLQRLYDFQHGDGGWGWWKEGDSDHYMSSYVVWGLSLARDAGLDVDRNVLDRGAQHLKVEIVEEENAPDLAAWMMHALGAWSGDSIGDAHVKAAFDNLWSKKVALNAYSRALFALAAQRMGRTSEAQTLIANLANGVQIDEAPDGSRIEPGAGSKSANTMKTAHFGEDRIWWRWSEGGVESTAFALRALLAVDPKNELVEPLTSWLIQNRRGAQWSNTRDTAIVVLALDDYLKASGEIAREVEYELVVNSVSLGKKKVTQAEMLSAPSVFTLPADKVKNGTNVIQLKRTSGDGPLYLSARCEFFSLEEPVPPRGNEIFVKRQYYKLVGRPTLLKGILYEKVPLEDNGSVKSGERVEVVVTVESKNNLEYLLFEDLKPAGLEAVQVKSGEYFFARELKKGEVEYRFAGGQAPALVPDPDDFARYTGRQAFVHQELRDRQVALFIDKLPQGVWEMRYTLRAEVPGRFHALPVLGHAMYVPEIKCNGAEVRITVDDRGVQGD